MLTVQWAEDWFKTFDNRTQAWIYWIGFYKFDTTLQFVQFLPYVSCYVLSLILKSLFVDKLAQTTKDLSVDPSMKTPENVKSDLELGVDVKKEFAEYF